MPREKYYIPKIDKLPYQNFLDRISINYKEALRFSRIKEKHERIRNKADHYISICEKILLKFDKTT